ncbi:MAG: hypothetical protein IKS28_06730 [Clostridia bacterium]|nr:hypothetical protein [Clostridia bacterium]
MRDSNEPNSRLVRFASAFFSKALESRTAFMLARHKSDGAGIISDTAESIERKYMIPVKRAVSSACEKSRILAFADGCLDGIMSLPVKTVGLIYFAAGVYILIKYIIGRFIPVISADTDSMICGALCTAFAGMVMSSSRSVRSAIGNSRLCSVISREVFGTDIKPDYEVRAVTGVFPAILTGVATGGLSAHTSFAFALLLLPSLLLLAAVMKKPESGITVLAALLPFIKPEHFAYAVVPVLLSAVFKIIQGKRSSKPGFSGFLTVMLCVLIAGAGICGNFATAVRYIPVILLSVFIPALYKTRDWFIRAMNVMLFSCTILSAVAVICRLAMPAMSNPYVSFTAGTLRSVIGFDMASVPVLAMLLSPYVAASIRRQSDVDGRIIESARLLLFIGCAAFSGSGEIFVITVIGCVLSFIFTSRTSLIYLIPAAVIIAILAMFFGGRFMEYCGMSFCEPENVLGRLPAANLLLGDSFDISSFRALYGNVSTFTLVTLSIGLFGAVLLYLLVAVMFLNSLKSMLVSPYGNNMKGALGGLTAGLTALAMSSISTDVAENAGIALAVSIFFGLLTAAQRISDKNCESFTEPEIDDLYVSRHAGQKRRRGQ